MIGVINPNATQTLALQLEFASNMTYQLAPGEPFPTETPIPRPTPGSGRPNLGEEDEDGDGGGGGGGGGGLSGGAIAGIVIGAAAVLVLGAALVYLCGRRGGFDKAYRKSVPPVAGVGGGGGGGGGGPAGEMVEAKYANAHPKSPGQASMATAFEEGTLRGSVAGGYYGGGGGTSPYLPTTTPSPGPGGNGALPGYYGFVPGHGHSGHERNGSYP
jgi:hypothetical protein